MYSMRVTARTMAVPRRKKRDADDGQDSTATFLPSCHRPPRPRLSRASSCLFFPVSMERFSSKTTCCLSPRTPPPWPATKLNQLAPFLPRLRPLSPVFWGGDLAIGLARACRKFQLPSTAPTDVSYIFSLLVRKCRNTVRARGSLADSSVWVCAGPSVDRDGFFDKLYMRPGTT